MGDLTENFSWSEFACKDGTPVPEDLRAAVIKTAEQLEKIRAKAQPLGGNYIKITSGYRTPEYNQLVGGSKRSQHLNGLAADIIINGLNAEITFDLVYDMMLNGEILAGGIGRYKTFTHVDFRGRITKWDNR
jgi:uncharacterized protein YcbK (DUF882 family)